MLIPFKGKNPETSAAVFIAPDATLIGDVTLGDKSSVWFGAVIRGDSASITIGSATNIQDNVVLHADAGRPLTIGNSVTVGHAAVLHGCTIGDNCVIGMGAIILNGAEIGANSIVAAGSLVKERDKFPPGCLITGNPAVVKKDLKTPHIKKVQESAEHYIAKAGDMQRAVEQL